MTQNYLPLKDKTALVTGAAKRIGRATALAIAAEGANVAVHYNSSADAAGSLAEQIRQAGRQAWTLGADLANAAETEALMSRAIETAGPVDILVNNASVFPASRLADVTSAAIATNVHIHATAPLLLSRALAEQGRPGHIINFLDTRITDYDRTHVAYHLSKRMLATITRMLALELAPAIAVNAVAPGLVLPPPDQSPDAFEKLAATNPMHRVGSVAGVAETVAFLLKSDFITGQIIYVDGGRHMKGRVYD